MDKVIVSPESEVNILVQVLLSFSLILKKICSNEVTTRRSIAVPEKKKNHHKKRRHRFRKSMRWRRQNVFSLF